MKLNLWVAGALVLLLSQTIITGCGTKSQAERGDQEVIEVVVQPVMLLNDAQVIHYSGTIQESVSIPLSFSTVGTVKKVLVEEGQSVRRGQTLAVLNDETHRNALRMAEAALNRAEDAVARLRPMYENGSLPEIKMVEVETGLQQAQASCDISRKSLSDCVLKATESGVVGKRSIDPGMSVIPGYNSITIVQVQRVYAKISVHESEIAALKKGSRATVSVPALGNADYSGTIDDIGILADPLSHTYMVKISLLNKDGRMRPGMICNVNVHGAGRNRVKVVPVEAVMLDNDGGAYVYTVNTASGTAARTPIERSALASNGICVSGGLPENALVVVAGQNKLFDSARISIRRTSPDSSFSEK